MEPSRSIRSREAGQAIIIIVFAFVGLLAFVGISVDLGRYLVAQAQLRRAVDAATLAGAAQFRLSGSTSTEAAVYDKVNQAARAMLRAHNVSTSTLESGVTVSICHFPDAALDAALCTVPPTKKVRVDVDAQVPLIFLSLVGWHSVGLSADATSEAASVDVALVLDTSDSMSSSVCQIADYPCDFTCSENNACEPLNTVKSSALQFLQFISPGYDRITVIPFAQQPGYCDPRSDCTSVAYDPVSNPTGKYLMLPTAVDPSKIASNVSDAQSFISNLKLSIPPWAGNPPGYPVPPCTGYDGNPYWDPRQCTNTNTGGAIRAAATELLKEFDPLVPVPGAGLDHSSKERLRVIVLLTDGVVNASGLGAEGPFYGTSLQMGFCPQYTWVPPGSAQPFCRASIYPALIEAARNISTSVNFDSMDYALDWADFAMLADGGNGIVIFTIGLGNEVINAQRGDPLTGAKLLRYISAGGDDGDPISDFCMDNAKRDGAGNPLPYDQSCGNYYYAPDAGQLGDIFKAIAGRIFTRINQ